MTVKGFNDKLKALNIQSEAQRSIDQTLPEFLDLGVEQLNEGRKIGRYGYTAKHGFHG